MKFLTRNSQIRFNQLQEEDEDDDDDESAFCFHRTSKLKNLSKNQQMAFSQTPQEHCPIENSVERFFYG